MGTTERIVKQNERLAALNEKINKMLADPFVMGKLKISERMEYNVFFRSSMITRENYTWSNFKNRRRAMLYWHLSGHRFSSDVQDKIYNIHGMDFLNRRIEKVISIAEKYSCDILIKMINKQVIENEKLACKSIENLKGIMK